jgi:hypothetical protein
MQASLLPTHYQPTITSSIPTHLQLVLSFQPLPSSRAPPAPRYPRQGAQWKAWRDTAGTTTKHGASPALHLHIYIYLYLYLGLKMNTSKSKKTITTPPIRTSQSMHRAFAWNVCRILQDFTSMPWASCEAQPLKHCLPR